MEIRVFKDIDEIGRDTVDSIADDGFFTYGYFKTVETSKAFKMAPLYLAAYEKNEIIAIAPCFIDLSNPLFELQNKLPFGKSIAQIISWLGIRPNQIVACFSPNSFHSKILLKEHINAKEILRLISEKIDEICKKERILFSSFLFVPECERLFVENLGNLGYSKFPSVDSFYLDVVWLNFEDYLKSLKSSKIRKNVKREIRICQESGVTIKEETEYGNLSQELSKLHSYLLSKYNTTVDFSLDNKFFKKLHEYAKDTAKVFVSKKSDQITGFVVYMKQKDTLDVYMCGFDYAAQTKTDFAYFNLIYYTPIKMAIRDKTKHVHFAINAENEKIKRGCKLVKTFSFVKCQSKLLGLFYRIYKKRSIPFNANT